MKANIQNIISKLFFINYIKKVCINDYYIFPEIE